MDFRNVPELLAARVADAPGKPFLFSERDGRSWTYAEFAEAVRRTAALLRSRGIRKGDVVSLLLQNSPEYIVAYFACWHIGAIAGPINSLLKSEEIEWVVSNSGSKLLLSEPPLVSGGSPQASMSEPPLVSGGPPRTSMSDPPPVSGGSPQAPPSDPPRAEQSKIELFGIPYVPFADLSGLPKTSDETPVADLSPDDEAIIIYTSGTTGKPKGCLLTHGNLIANARQITEWMKFTPDDRLLTVMPLFHMNAVTVTTMTALYCGGSTVVSPKFSASRFWDIIDRYRITSFGSVATMLSMLLSASGEQEAADNRNTPLTAHGSRSTSLRFAMCGSAPVPAELLKRFEETFGVLVIEGYGLSESTCRSTFNPPDERRRPGSCGLPIGNEMRIVDDCQNDVPEGELGEIVLRGPNIFKGYFKNPEATAKAFRNGWFHTGDIGRRDADGFYYIADRKSDMIIRGGENIYPREIDDLLYTHPAVAHAAAVGIPDPLYGEEVTAFIVLKDGYTAAPGSPHEEWERHATGQGTGGSPPGRSGGNINADERSDDTSGGNPGVSERERGTPNRQTISAQDIIEFCRQHLADYKCPKTVHFVSDIPKGPTGKLLKRELARLLPPADPQNNTDPSGPPPEKPQSGS